MAVKRYDGSQWVTVAGKGDQGTSSSIATWVKTATGGETSVSGNDDNSQPLSYTVGQELVFINGALQKRGADYTATTGNSITGLTALAANDVVTVWTVNAFSVTGAIANSIVDAKGDLIVATGADTPGRLAVGANGLSLVAASGEGTGLKWGYPNFVGARAYDTGQTSISNNTWTAIAFAGENFDTDSFHSTSTNTSRMTVPSGKAGKYLVTANAAYGSSSTTGSRHIAFYKNGSRLNPTISAVGPYASLQITTILDLAENDYVELYAFQSSGGTISTESDWQSFAIQYLGA